MSRPFPLQRPSAPRPTNSRVLTRCCVALALCGVTLVAGCHRETPKPVQGKPPEVMIAYPVEQTVADFEEFTGRTAAVQMVEIRARVSGYLNGCLFNDGADVKQGEPLFEIDARPYKAELARARAAVAQAEATVAQSTAHIERLKRQEDRVRGLLAKGAISQDEYDAVAFELAESEAARDAAEAARAAAEANVELATLNVEWTRIPAPISGRISRNLVDEGNLVQADVTPLATIVSTDPIYAYFDVDERTVLRLRRLVQEGAIQSARESEIRVQLSLADEEDFSLTGTINFVDNQVEPTTGTLRLRAVIDNPTGLLSPGFFVRLRVPIGRPRRALVVREKALGSDQGQRYVYVVDEKDEVAYRRVEVGRLNDNGYRVIEEGLQPGDRVIVNGLQRVRPGVKVTPKPAEQDVELAADQEPAKPLVTVNKNAEQ